MSDGCLLLLARAEDAAARTLRQQAPHRLAHASLADLSCTGWRYESGRPEQASACAGGHVIPAEHITAVVCRFDVIRPAELPHVHRDDRAYVAAEITAFLRAWLAQFAGRRFNEPTWASLAGPAWHSLQWTWRVARIGVPVAALSRSPANIPLARCETVVATVVGGDVFGPTDPTLIDYSLRIARAVKSELLAVTFVRDHEWRFLSADPCPELDSVTAAAVVRRAFTHPSGPSVEPRADPLCDVA
jgi:hypothetical protein